MSPKKVRPHLSEDIKNRIAGLRQSNLSYKQIFDILKKENVKTSLSAVKRIGQRFEIEGSVRRKSGSGRPRASTVKDDHRLKMTVLKDRKKTYVDHSKEFKTAAGNSLSRMTISRRLNEVGFNSKKCAKKPLFPAIKVLKLAWPIFFVHECMLQNNDLFKFRTILGRISLCCHQSKLLRTSKSPFNELCTVSFCLYC